MQNGIVLLRKSIELDVADSQNKIRFDFKNFPYRQPSPEDSECGEAFPFPEDMIVPIKLLADFHRTAKRLARNLRSPYNVFLSSI